MGNCSLCELETDMLVRGQCMDDVACMARLRRAGRRDFLYRKPRYLLTPEQQIEVAAFQEQDRVEEAARVERLEQSRIPELEAAFRKRMRLELNKPEKERQALIAIVQRERRGKDKGDWGYGMKDATIRRFINARFSVKRAGMTLRPLGISLHYIRHVYAQVEREKWAKSHQFSERILPMGWYGDKDCGCVAECKLGMLNAAWHAGGEHHE